MSSNNPYSEEGTGPFILFCLIALAAVLAAVAWAVIHVGQWLNGFFHLL